MTNVTEDKCEDRMKDAYTDIKTKLPVKVFWTVISGLVIITSTVLGAHWGYSFNLNTEINQINRTMAKQEGFLEGKQAAEELSKTLSEATEVIRWYQNNEH